MSTSTPEAPRCPIRGHEHSLNHHQAHTQMGSGSEADTWECPSGRYRWFLLRGRGKDLATNGLRMNRPRWGWSKS